VKHLLNECDTFGRQHSPQRGERVIACVGKPASNRPVLQELLRDIEACKVDCVVVYKVNRLSRSLLDFARLLSLFEKRGLEGGRLVVKRAEAERVREIFAISAAHTSFSPRRPASLQEGKSRTGGAVSISINVRVDARIAIGQRVEPHAKTCWAGSCPTCCGLPCHTVRTAQRLWDSVIRETRNWPSIRLC
jgi:Resolvase, N terminal domain